MIDAWGIDKFFNNWSLGSNPDLNLLKNINHISFFNLEVLHLSNCEIFSIEPLAFLDAPKLKGLRINRLQGGTGLKPFAKCSFKHLEHLFFWNKHANHQLTHFTRTKLNPQ
jgi:hypothetical protein